MMMSDDFNKAITAHDVIKWLQLRFLSVERLVLKLL